MELELIYSKIAYEDARYTLELKHFDCKKIEEEIKHLKILSKLKEEKEKLLKAQTEIHFAYNPKKICDSSNLNFGN